MRKMKKLSITSHSRRRLYYDSYEYSCKFVIPHLSTLRDFSHEKIDSILDWKEHNGKLRNFGGYWGTIETVTPKHRRDLHLLLDFMMTCSSEYKLQISVNTGHFYTNNFANITQLHAKPYVKVINCRQAQVDIPRDSIVLPRSPHKYRTYFKNQQISVSGKENLYRLFQSQDVRLAPSFNEWFTQYKNYKYVWQNFFVDYNDDRLPTLIGLVCPIKIKETLNIINHKYMHGKDTRETTSN
jgi:hypothetical protein